MRPFNTTPIAIYPTPRMTATFILRLFMYVSSFFAMYHAGSTPKVYAQSLAGVS